MVHLLLVGWLVGLFVWGDLFSVVFFKPAWVYFAHLFFRNDCSSNQGIDYNRQSIFCVCFFMMHVAAQLFEVLCLVCLELVLGVVADDGE